ncbi:hypothetical protein NPIL_218121 [Nephila pilipes]|uniref:Uncharacterized protein n=1 Tax=Nephila pilipes TaxID=299642 RepID=A0A8X6P2M6_NEPPI|nr:hypothetical protein NPIL_218121 [Nephila pilipes]
MQAQSNSTLSWVRGKRLEVLVGLADGSSGAIIKAANTMERSIQREQTRKKKELRIVLFTVPPLYRQTGSTRKTLSLLRASSKGWAFARVVDVLLRATF